MICDDLFNVAGGPPVDAERLYSLIIRQRASESWRDVWDTVQEKNRVQDRIVVKVMYHYTPYISDVIAGRGLSSRTPPVFTFDPERLAPFYGFFSDAVWVHIERSDVFAQTVSIYMAEQSKVWERRARDGDLKADLFSAVEYDREKLLGRVKLFMAERAMWPRFFEQFGIDPIRIHYEVASETYPGYLDELVETSGLQPVSPVPPRRMLKVATAKNAQFIEQLRRDLQEEQAGG